MPGHWLHENCVWRKPPRRGRTHCCCAIGLPLPNDPLRCAPDLARTRTEEPSPLNNEPSRSARWADLAAPPADSIPVPPVPLAFSIAYPTETSANPSVTFESLAACE